MLVVVSCIHIDNIDRQYLYKVTGVTHCYVNSHTVSHNILLLLYTGISDIIGYIGTSAGLSNIWDYCKADKIFL